MDADVELVAQGIGKVVRGETLEMGCIQHVHLVYRTVRRGGRILAGDHQFGQLEHVRCQPVVARSHAPEGIHHGLEAHERDAHDHAFLHIAFTQRQRGEAFGGAHHHATRTTRQGLECHVGVGNALTRADIVHLQGHLSYQRSGQCAHRA